MTIDGVTYENIDVHGKLTDILETVRENSDYTSATKQGSCYSKFLVAPVSRNFLFCFKSDLEIILNAVCTLYIMYMANNDQ